MSDLHTTAIVGMGKTGCSIARFLQSRGTACEAFDENGKVKLPEGLEIPLHTGRIKADALLRFGQVAVSPGVIWSHPALVAAREAGIPVFGDLDLFLEHFNGEILAVTGTNGKTTTVTLIGTLLETLPGGIEIAGNIGNPMLDMLSDSLREEPLRTVLELSSFQLERCKGIRPKWAALLNVQPDHADMHESEAAYTATKLRLFEQQGEGDTAMLPLEDRWNKLADELRGRGVRVLRFGRVESFEQADAGIRIGAETELFWRQDDEVQSISERNILSRGVHQHLNMAVAAQAAADHGVSATVIGESMTSFRGLSHRVQDLGLFHGRHWYDDSKATNPDAAIAALNAFDRVIWICGGARKGLDLSPLRFAVGQHVEHAYIIGKDAKAFKQLLEEAGVSCTIAVHLQKAVQLAARYSDPLPVLLSPAAASQDQFRDYADRGRQFAEAIRHLEKAA